MWKSIITPEDNYIRLDIPAEYVGKQLEITCEPIIINPEKKKTMADFWGILSNEAADELYKSVAKSREEWNRSI